jgi:c-di-GMP-binding flagellar brake protein YcgR
MEERRQYVRFEAPFCVEYKKPPLNEKFQGVIKNISIGGARILLDTSFDISPCSLASIFLLLPEITLNIKGEVVWVRKTGNKKEVGVRFVNLPDTHKDDIYRYIFRYFKEEYTKKWWLA